MTLPTVVAQTTMLRSRARWAGSARSAAAYRLWLFDVVAPPNSRLATSRKGKLPTTPAVMRPTAPTPASAYPSTRPGRRPRAAITRDIGIAMRAAPRIWNVPPRPAHRGEPETSSARSAPTARPAERPTPPSIWDTTRVRTTCRWMASGGAVVVTAAVCRSLGSRWSGAVRGPHRRSRRLVCGLPALVAQGKSTSLLKKVSQVRILPGAPTKTALISGFPHRSGSSELPRVAIDCRIYGTYVARRFRRTWAVWDV